MTTSDPGAVKTTADWAGVRVTELGTTGGDALVVDGLPDLPLAELRAAWSATLPALFGTPEATVGAVPTGTVPTLMPAPIPADELRAAVDPARAWLAGEAEQPPRAVLGAAVKTRPAGWPSRCRAVRWSCGCRRTSPSSGARSAAHPRHPAERGRDRRGHLAAAGHRSAHLGRAVAEGAVTASGNRADLCALPAPRHPCADRA